MTIKYEHVPAEDKWDSETHRYGRDYPNTMGSNVESIAIEHDCTGNFKLHVNIVSKKGTDKQKLADQATALLDHAGLEDIETSGISGNQASCSVSVNLGKNQPEAINGIIALTRDAPDKNGSTRSTPAMIDVEACSQIIDMELARQKIAPSVVGLLRFDVVHMSDDQRAQHKMTSPLCYVDVDLSGYALSPVTYISEDSHRDTNMETGETIHSKRAIINVTDGNMTAVKKALEQSGIQFGITPKSENIKCHATSSQVIVALASSGILPLSFAEEAKSTYTKHHPELSQTAPPPIPAVRHNTGSKFSM